MGSSPFFFRKASEMPKAKINMQKPLNKSMKNNMNPNTTLSSFLTKLSYKICGMLLSIMPCVSAKQSNQG
jgi:hypothetical protein